MIEKDLDKRKTAKMKLLRRLPFFSVSKKTEKRHSSKAVKKKRISSIPISVFTFFILAEGTKIFNSDFLASFTDTPGTVIQAGYGSVCEKMWRDGQEYFSVDDYIQIHKAFFFKASYLWRF